MNRFPLCVILIALLQSFWQLAYADIVVADQMVDSTGVVWSLTSDGLLTLSGEGRLPAYWQAPDSAPWYAHREDIHRLRVNEGVRSIGPYSFSGYSGLTHVSLPASLDTLGIDVEFAQGGVESLTQHQGIALRNARRNVPVVTTPAGPFAQCTALRSVTCGGSRMFLQTDAFQDCGDLLFFVPDTWSGSTSECYGAASVTYETLPSVHDTTLVEVHDTAYVDVTDTLYIEVRDTILVTQTDTLFEEVLVQPDYILLTLTADERVTTRFSLVRGDSILLTIRPEDGWEVGEVLLDTLDITHLLTDSLLQTPALTADAALRVTYRFANADELYTEDEGDDGIIRTRQGLKISIGSDGAIIVEGAEGQAVSVFTLGGSLVTTMRPTMRRAMFRLPAATYIIRVGEEFIKTQVR